MSQLQSGTRRSRCECQRQRAEPLVQLQRSQLPPCCSPVSTGPADHTFLGAQAACLLRPKTGTSPWEAHNPPQTSRGISCTCSHSGHSPHTPTVSALPSLLPAQLRQVSSNKLLLSPLLSGQGDNTRGQPQGRDRAQNQSGTPGSSVSKGKSLLWPQMQWIKSNKPQG